MNEYRENLKSKMNQYVHLVYGITKTFPKQEIYGTTSQLKRAALSVVLNYIEGYARRKTLIRLNFLETSYGSLIESKYLLDFSLEEEFVTLDHYKIPKRLAEEIGAMLWAEICNLEKSVQK